MRQLPRGTVTLLFTDIEGSTRLLQELGREDYVEALMIHRRLLREAVARYGGVEVELQGDSFHFAFPSARAAVEAAADAQRALAGHAWTREPMRVRMGVHTGEPVVADELYAGLDVHRAARIMGAAHGGQILVSRATAERAAVEGAAGFEFRDLGEHRLKDLLEPQRLYQLSAEGLEAEFPALRTLEYRLTNLPVQPTSFVGREREVEEARTLLQRDDVRLLTLTGPGGTGKTRLALQAAAELVEHFPHGVFLVTLAPITDPELVIPTVAQTLGLREEPGRPIAETLKAELSGKEVLLVLDNFEQVDEAALDVSSLLAAVPRITVLVTSRAPLHIAAEFEYPVSPLGEEEAVGLFVERAQAARHDFALDGERRHVAEICRRLDCLPLAVELAAARVKILEPAALLERLEERLTLLTGGPRDRDERQRTLRAAIEWSHDLLGDDERTLFRRLAVFAGGWTSEAAETVCVPAVEGGVLDVLSSLLDQNLIRRDELDGEPRFSMLETIREYALERFAESSEATELRRRHADHYAALAEEARRAVEAASDSEPDWLARLEMEHDNLRAALRGARELDDAELEFRLVTALGNFWFSRGHVAEGRRRTETALERVAQVALPARLAALNQAARFAHAQGDLSRAREASEDALSAARDLGDAGTIAEILNLLSIVTRAEGDLSRAIALSEEALDYARAAGRRGLEAAIVSNRGDFALYEGDFTRARTLFEQSAAGFEGISERNAAFSLGNAGVAALHEGSAADAASLLRSALSMSSNGALPDVAYYLEALAAVEASREAGGRAARLLGTASVLREALEIALEPFEREMHERTEAALRSALGDERFDEEFAAGRAMEPGDAVKYALESKS